jgi:hypothetical protein
MVLWELMTLLRLPHGRYSNAELEEKVWKALHPERPPLLSTIDGEESIKKGTLMVEQPIRDLLRRCWSPIINDRPTMKAVHAALGMHFSEISCDITGNSQ